MEQLRAQKAAVEAVAARHGAREIRVFGSTVRGEETPGSDIDLLVDFEPGRSLFDQSALTSALTELLGRPVEVVPTDSLHWLLRRRILREALPL
jgi:predicted nucleotidyltransferase